MCVSWFMIINKWFWYMMMSAIILWLFGVFITHLALYFSVYEQIILRSIIAFLCCVIVAILYRESFSILNNTISRKWSIVFLLAFPLSLVFFTTSVTMTNATVSIFLLYAWSLISTFMIGKLVFGEIMSVIHRISLWLCLIGVIFFSQLWVFDAQILYLFPGLLAWLLEGWVHAARRGMGWKFAPSVLLSYQHASTILICLIVWWLAWSLHGFTVLSTIPLAIWWYGVLFGILLCVMSWTLLQWFRQYDVNKGTVLLSSELLFAVIFNFLLLSVVPNWYEIIGWVLIAIASILPMLWTMKVKA